MANVSISVRLAPNDLVLIDKRVTEGLFTNRSDVVRHSIRQCLYEFEKRKKVLREVADIAVEKGITMKDVRKSIRKTRKEIYRDVYGDD